MAVFPAWLLVSLGVAWSASAPQVAPAPTPVSPIRFREVSQAWGLAFRHHHGGSGQYFFVETNSGGVVLFDFDGDGDDDVFLVDGGTLPGYKGETPRSRLYRNEGGGRFRDWTDRSRLAVARYGMGATAGDADGDGDLDLYVTELGPDQLFRNEGDGTFTDVTAAAGLGDPGYGMSAAFADPDRDGDLDLYVANYVEFTVENNRYCGDEARGLRGYCNPLVYDGAPDNFYRNLGRGAGGSGAPRFERATADAGLPADTGKGMGVVWGDVDDDGWPDLYVANDTTPNFLFRNRGKDAAGKQTFEDVSLVSGTSVSERGIMEAGMGVDLADTHGDGLLDIVVTNFAQESNALYRGVGGGFFTDSRSAAGIVEASLPMLGWGVAFADFDEDGDLDLVVANGHVLDRPELFGGFGTYAQRNQVFANRGDGVFREVLDAGLDVVRPSRGLAVGDLDGDGDLDVVIVNSNEAAEVYENLGGGRRLAAELVGRESNRFGVGARLVLEAGGKRQVREVKTGSSFLSQNSLTVHFGLPAPRADVLEVRWPSGRRQRLLEPPAGRRLVIVEP